MLKNEGKRINAEELMKNHHDVYSELIQHSQEIWSHGLYNQKDYVNGKKISFTRYDTDIFIYIEYKGLVRKDWALIEVSDIKQHLEESKAA